MKQAASKSWLDNDVYIDYSRVLVIQRLFLSLTATTNEGMHIFP
jgi:hypothetical protein